MAHLSLYRKYRPQTFAEVIGQDHVTTTLANALSEGRLHHAYLFTGPRGTGKTSTARILAKAVNCVDGPAATPCNACPQCEAITTGSSIDVVEIDAASHGGVDDVRDLRDRVAFAPASARMKVYIVDECHMLTTAGWNAFLKTVEEPPGHVLFVFATTEPHKVLATILSRTQRFDFKRVSAAVLAAHCEAVAEREGLTLEPGVLDVVVRAGDGSVRDTLSVLDQVVAFTGTEITARDVAEVLGTVGDEFLFEAAELVAAGDVPGLCRLVGRLADAGVDLRQFARDAVEHLRELFLVSTAPEAGLVDATPERLTALRAQAGRLGRVELLRSIELLAEAQAQMRRGNTRLPLEIAMAKAAMPDSCADPAALAARLDRLERRLDGGQPPVPAPAGQTPAAAPADTASSADAAGADVPADAAPADAAPADAAGAAAPAVSAPQAATTPATLEAATTPATLEAVQQRWPAVLDAVKAHSRRLHAFVSPGQPVGLEGRVLTLRFAPDAAFHAEQAASEECAAALESVFDEVLGAALRVRSVVVDGGGSPGSELDEDASRVAEAEEDEAAGRLPGDAEAHALAVETLTRDLGARVVDE